MRKYLVWCPLRGQTEDDAKLVDALSHRDAATYWAENCAGWNGNPFNDITVRVERQGDMPRRVYEIEVDVVPMPLFEAARMREIQP